MMNMGRKEDIEMRKVLKDFDRDAARQKKKNWAPYKKKYPDLYNMEFGIRPKVSQDTYDKLKEDNEGMKAEIKKMSDLMSDVLKLIKNKDKEIEKLKLKVIDMQKPKVVLSKEEQEQQKISVEERKALQKTNAQEQRAFAKKLISDIHSGDASERFVTNIDIIKKVLNK